MKVLQIGYGKMGKFTYKALINNKDITNLTVCDKVISCPYIQDGVNFVSNYSDLDIKSFDCVFIITPAITHCTILKDMLNGGIKNIFVEKPAVMNKDEFDEISTIKKNARIVNGYILRQSDILISLKKIIKNLNDEGYNLELCSVTYQKNLPLSCEKRALGDIGVFEEIVHVWDLLFDFLEFRKADCKICDNILEYDPEKKNRVIFAQLSYYLKFENYNSLIRLTSSFKAKDKKRDFFFTFNNDNGDRKHICLSFDTPSDIDKLIVTDSTGSVTYLEEYPSLLKLEHQVKQVMHYFKTDNPTNLSLFEDSKTIIELMKEAGVNIE